MGTLQVLRGTYPRAYRTISRPVDVLSGVRQDFGVQFVLDHDGTLVYAPGADGNVGALVWAGRDGSVASGIWSGCAVS